jgi:hypothetical protein
VALSFFIFPQLYWVSFQVGSDLTLIVNEIVRIFRAFSKKRRVGLVLPSVYAFLTMSFARLEPFVTCQGRVAPLFPEHVS